MLEGALRRFFAQRREQDGAFGAVHKRGLECGFEFFQAGAERRLGDVAGARGFAEMAVRGERGEVAELFEGGEHGGLGAGG